MKLKKNLAKRRKKDKAHAGEVNEISSKNKIFFLRGWDIIIFRRLPKRFLHFTATFPDDQERVVLEKDAEKKFFGTVHYG